MQYLHQSPAESFLNKRADILPVRLFVDMDGTLAVFHPAYNLETLYEPGYFKNLPPHHNVVQAVKSIAQMQPDIEVYILSAVLTDSPYALKEKNCWLNRHLPGIDGAHRIFLPCSADKKDFIPGGVRETDFLLDDYTYNLSLWRPYGRGINLLNGINHTRGTWKDDCIRYDKAPEELMDNLLAVIHSKQTIKDEKPEITNAGVTEVDYDFLLATIQAGGINHDQDAEQGLEWGDD